MEEFYYYWSMWFLWVLTTFILEKNRTRFFASAFILLNIILSMYQVRFILLLNGAYLLFYAGAYLLGGYAALHRSIKRLLLHLSMVSAYGFLFLFALYDPVWFILKPEWLIIILFVIMTLTFEKSFINRLALMVLGMCHGELLYSLIIRKFHEGLVAGGYSWLSMCSAGIVLLYGVSQYERLVQQIHQKWKRLNKGATKMS
ncbi:hypothetical protein OZL92_04355 [Bacillus sonorensis]|uniref:Membrane protein YphA n=2 Tax=Bacillus sonorensis TaxID=119858 RepID=M5P936_9BACI|nr:MULTISPECIES: hypothetical protein [Bacillus]TWK82582.1 hypothetical protein CHCC20335_3625 [Bacillus paralicheniformis]ASB88689.1 uncharacterized protein S101395_02181 [Bacillus sonorensis]EME76501.1 membrane protein YphA [Bacillus sonorensis L12]MBG9915501.1 membrane protein [Bacillus sonorensis]MCF7618044.1 hypothetical protein [Bacillus sonorensis]